MASTATWYVTVSLLATEPLYKITLLPASAVPVIVGVVLLVVVAVVVNDVGALGAVVSTVIDNEEE